MLNLTPPAHAALSLTVALLACFPASPAGAEAAAPVEVVMPERARALRTVDLTGSFTARHTARLSPRLPGLVAERLVDTGDAVAAGDVLLRLDPRLAELEVARARAAEEERRTALAEAQRLLAEAERLGRDSFLPETEIEGRRSRVAMAEAALATATSEVATARERLARHDLVAPFAGAVARRLTEVGEWVDTGTVVLELVDTGQLWLDVMVPQRLWPELAPDTRVSAWADALPKLELTARVQARVPVSDPSARTFLVRLRVDEPGPDITPGMSARARFELAGTGEVLRVPRDALIRYPDGTTTVWVVDRGQDQPRVNQQPVTVRRYVGDLAELDDGLAPDQPVVVRGNELLTEDQPVRVVAPPTASAR